MVDLEPEFADVRFLLQSASQRQIDEIDSTLIDAIDQCLQDSACEQHFKPKLLRLINELELQSKSVDIGSTLWHVRQSLMSKIGFNTTNYYIGSYVYGRFKLLSQPREPSNVIKIIIEDPCFDGFAASELKAIKACNATHVLLVHIGDSGTEVKINDEPEMLEIHAQKQFESTSPLTRICLIILAIVGLIYLMTHVKTHS